MPKIISKLIKENGKREKQKSCSFFNGKFCFEKDTAQPKREKSPKIKSLLIQNSLNTITNRRNNNVLYKVESRHLVFWNTADC